MKTPSVLNFEALRKSAQAKFDGAEQRRAQAVEANDAAIAAKAVVEKAASLEKLVKTSREEYDQFEVDLADAIGDAKIEGLRNRILRSIGRSGSDLAYACAEMAGVEWLKRNRAEILKIKHRELVEQPEAAVRKFAEVNGLAD